MNMKNVQKTDAEAPEKIVFHLLDRNSFEKWDQKTAYKPDDFAREGFVHLSTLAQIEGSANRYFEKHLSIWVFKLESTLLGKPLRYESAAGLADRSGRFPHYYAALPTEAIIAQAEWQRDSTGTFLLASLADFI